MKKVLVTGANGFIGRRLCEHLKQEKIFVRVLLRAETSGPWDEVFAGDLAQGNLPPTLLTDIDTVIHLAGIAHAMNISKKDEQIYWDVNVGGTKKLLDMATAAGTERFIYFSSIKAMGEPGEDCVDENWPELPVDAYGLSKREAEKQVLAWGDTHKRHACCLRPTLVYGPYVKGNLLRLIGAIDKGYFPSLPDTHNRRSMISVDDVIRVVKLVSCSKLARGKTYILSDGQDYSTRQLYEAICKVLAKPVARVVIPKYILTLIAKTGDIVGSLLGRAMPLNSEALKRLLGSACYKADRLKSELSWKAEKSFFDDLPEMIKTYKSSR